MAQPMFSALGGMTPDEMLRRLGRTGAPPGSWEDEGLPLGWQAAAAGDKGVAAQLAPAPGGINRPAPPGQVGPGSFGKLLEEAGAFMGGRGSPAPGQPSAPTSAGNPFSSLAAPQMPAFTPAALPEKSPFEPVRVEGAIPHGMFNPAGDSPWDRSRTANSAEEELRLRQDAKYNDVMNLIRPQGTYFPSQVWQPHEITMLERLGGRQAGDLTQGRQIAATSGDNESERRLRLTMENQKLASGRDAANLQSQTEIQKANIEAGSRNNPTALKLQFAAPYLAAGGSVPQLAGMFHALESSVFGKPSAPGSVAPASASAPGQTTADDEVAAMGAINNLAAMMGKGQPGPQFQMNEFNPQEAGKVMDFVAGLPPGVQTPVLRELMSGRLGNQMQIRDNIMKVGAGANYQIQPPINPKTGKPVDEFSEMGMAPPPYAIQDEGGKELFRYTHNPNDGFLGSLSSRALGGSPYTQLQLPNGLGTIPLDGSLMNPSIFATKLPRQTLENRARISQQMLRMMQQSQPK